MYHICVIANDDLFWPAREINFNYQANYTGPILILILNHNHSPC